VPWKKILRCRFGYCGYYEAYRPNVQHGNYHAGFAVILGDYPISEANTFLLLKSAKFIFAILAFICCVGIFASLARGKIHNGNNNH